MVTKSSTPLAGAPLMVLRHGKAGTEQEAGATLSAYALRATARQDVAPAIWGVLLLLYETLHDFSCRTVAQRKRIIAPS